jgi:hypothetical protein
LDEITGEVVERLIEQELDKSSREGIELYMRLCQEPMTEEERKERLKTIRGYGVWWSTDSGVRLKRAKVADVKKLREGGYEVSATCILEIETAHELLPGEFSEENIAKVRMKVSDTLEVEEFDFQWI